jgi:hypothetical protein
MNLSNFHSSILHSGVAASEPDFILNPALGFHQQFKSRVEFIYCDKFSDLDNSFSNTGFTFS